MKESYVILVDKNDKYLGEMEKLESHKKPCFILQYHYS